MKAAINQKIEYSILKLVCFQNENLFSFASGLVAAIPLSVMFRLLDYTITWTKIGELHFIFHLLLMVSSVFMCMKMIRFTLHVIEIKEESEYEIVYEARINNMQNNTKKKMNVLKKYLCSFILWSIVFFVSMVSIFIINNTPFHNSDVSGCSTTRIINTSEYQ